MLVGAVCLAIVGGARSASASDGGTSSAAISPALLAPRFAAGSDAAAPAHINNFSPASINYADCVDGIDIQFSLSLTGAPAGDEIQVWAGAGSADCTQPSARTAASSSSPSSFPGRCWPVTSSSTFDPTGTGTTARLHVRDLVAYLGQDNPPTTYSPTTSSSVCTPYATTSAVQLNIYFMFVKPAAAGGADAGTTAVASPDGVSGLYQTVAALVGPFAPLGVTVPNSGITPTSLTVYWEPQSESIIQGYNIYQQDQGVNGANTGVTATDGAASSQMSVYCHPRLACDAGSSSTSDAGSKDAGSRDAGSADSGPTDAAASDAGGQDATLADASSGGGGCDAGQSDAWVPEDAAAFAGMTDAALAALGCELTGPVNAQTPAAQTGGTCVSGPLQSTFTVDGGVGSAASSTTTVDSGGTSLGADASADAGVDSGATQISSTTTTSTVAETAGISLIPSRYLAFYELGASSSSYTLSGLTTGHQYAVAVAAVDSYGNVGPIGPLGCSTPTAVDDFYTAYGNDGGRAGGGYCALTAAGAPTFGSVFGLGVVGAAVLFARRRRPGRRTR